MSNVIAFPEVSTEPRPVFPPGWRARLLPFRSAKAYDEAWNRLVRARQEYKLAMDSLSEDPEAKARHREKYEALRDAETWARLMKVKMQ